MSDAEINEGSLPDLHRQVQRKFGRCMFRLQQYELLAKSLAARHEVSSFETHAKRAKNVADKPLGSVIGKLTDSFLTVAGSEASKDATAEEERESKFVTPESPTWFRSRSQVAFSAEDYQRIKSELKELVDLRNDLVHHFIERFDVWSESGCAAADEYLQQCFVRIDAHFAQLRQWNQGMEQAKAKLAAFLASPDALKFFASDDD